MRKPPKYNVKTAPRLDKPRFTLTYKCFNECVSLVRNWVHSQVEALGDGPTVNTVTPLECTIRSKFLEREFRSDRDAHEALRCGSHVKVDFYLNIDSLRLEQIPDSSWYLPWTKSGDVDLSPLISVYGVKTLQVIDPVRWTEFVPGRPNTLSALAVQTLRLNDPMRGIKITEPPVPFVTRLQRNIRIAYLLCYFYIFSLYHLVRHGGLGRRDVSVPLGDRFWNAYRSAKRGRAIAVSAKEFIALNWQNIIICSLALYIFCWMPISEAVSTAFLQSKL